MSNEINHYSIIYFKDTFIKYFIKLLVKKKKTFIEIFELILLNNKNLIF